MAGYLGVWNAHGDQFLGALMSCESCQERAEECWEFTQLSDEKGVNPEPCLCECHDQEPWRRASGMCRCAICGLAYFKHARGGPIGMDGKRFLRRLCSGALVKL